MSDQQLKFSPLTIRIKGQIRRLRLLAGNSMAEGSRLLGVSRKQLEDIETTRDYGCHLEIELLAKVKVVYNVSLDSLVGELPADQTTDFFARKRRRNAD
jgi:transcriptional regulator with XRE-family HTH domain